MAKPVILVVDDLATSYESLVASIGRHDGGRLAREFDYIHLDCFSALRQWYSRNRSRFVSLIVQDVDFSHVQDERKLVDYPDILKPLQRTLDIKALQGFLIYGYLLLATLLILAAPLYLQRPVSMALTLVGLMIGLVASPPTPGMAWFVPVFYLKLLVSHLLKEWPYAPEVGG